jgi:lipid-A-disaccharide synthase-like uncharacterized protein
VLRKVTRHPATQRAARALFMGIAGFLALALPAQILAAAASQPDQSQATWGLWPWMHRMGGQLSSPLFWFGIGAQTMFFARFMWQWIVSEKRGHSTIPIAFWYFSLAGGLAMALYGCLREDLVIILGQVLSCAIYARNLMLIYGQAKRRQLAGLPRIKLRSEVTGENDTESGY